MNELTDRDESGLGWVYPPQPQQTFIQEIIGMISGVIELVEGQDYIDVGFGSAQPSVDWVLIETSIINTADSTPINVWPGVVTSKTTTGFRLQLNGTPDSGNYFLNWSIRGVFGYYFSGPVSGRRNVASSPFTVRLPDESTLDGTVIITPDDGGVGGTFTPATVALTVAAPSATFTYTPSTYGPRSIGTDNDRGLIDPAQIGFTATASEYTLDGPTDGSVGQPSTNFTVALPVGSAVLGSVTVTPDDGGDGGTFTPTTVELTTGIPSATFTYTPTTPGAKTIGVTNDGGLTDPNSLTYTAADPQHLLDTLVSYWKMDEASGTRADIHGSNDLTQHNGVLADTGVINDAAKFIATSSQYLSVASNASLQVTGDFTWSLWVYINPGASSAFAMSKDLSGGVQDYSIGYYAPTPKFFFQIANDGPSAPDFLAAEGQWHHVVVWYDSGTSKLSIRLNDSATHTGSGTVALIQNTQSLGFGCGGVDNLPAQFLDGLIDEVGFWKRLLTPYEISRLYNVGAGLPYSSFQA